MNFAHYVTELRRAIREMYGCESVHLRSEPVELSENEMTLWSGNVECFALLNCKAAAQCYGWGTPTGPETRDYVVVLQKAPAETPQRAVQMWLWNQRP
ncbi:MAG: hypothetical protein ACTHN5_04785 [Phycisphaerae bacterium]